MGKAFLIIFQALLALSIVSCDSSTSSTSGNTPDNSENGDSVDSTTQESSKIDEQISAAMTELKTATKRYQETYENHKAKLSKEALAAIWGTEEQKEAFSEEMIKKTLEGLKGLELPPETNPLAYLTRKSPDEARANFKEDLITKVLKRMTTKGKSEYKMQAGFAFNYQPQFAPGGFIDTPALQNQMLKINEIVGAFVTAATAHDEHHVVFSNEALNESRYPETTSSHLDESSAERNTATSKNSKMKTDVFDTDGIHFLKATMEDHQLYTTHLSSLKEKDREAESIKLAKDLTSIVTKLLGSEDQSKFAFAGDLNRYLFVDNKETGTRTLREGVQETLDKFNLVLVLPSGLVNKNIRPVVHEQWHKLDFSISETEVVSQPDSLAVLEAYNEGFDYETLLIDNGLGAKQDIFFPSASGKDPIVHKIDKVAQPFESGFIMDHKPVRGRLASIFSGADADGAGNAAKKFIFEEPFKTPSKIFQFHHLRAMAINMNLVSDFIETL